MKIRSTRERLLASTFIGGIALAAVAAAPAMAQTQPTTPTDASGEPVTQLDQIVVTGSRIVRQDYSSTSPIVTVDQADFQATGAVTIDALINDLPQFVPSINFTSNNPSNGGQANLDLRGLGTVRTLVLMNGRRVIPSNASGVVDVNIFPTALVQNIEVISGGASAAYGSDALAGVANFILNESFEGIQVDAQYGETDRNDGITESYSVTLGGNFDNGRGNAVLSLGRSVRGEIFNATREFAAVSGRSGATPLGSTTFDLNNRPSQAFLDAYFAARGGAEAGAVPQSSAFGFNNDGSIFSYIGTRNFQSPGGIDFDGFAVPGGDYGYNTGALNYLALPLDRWNAYAAARYRVNDSAEVYGNFLFAQYNSANELAATPAAGAPPATGFRVPSTNPFITPDIRAFLDARPDPTASFALDKRFNALGGRRGSENYSVYQMTAGMRGDLDYRDWTYDASIIYGRNDRTTRQTGNVSRSSVQRLLDAPDGGVSLCEGGFNPFGETALSAACASFVGRTSQNVTEIEQTVGEIVTQGGLFDLPAGEVRAAFGLQYRENKFNFVPDASLAQSNPITPHLGADGLPDGGNIGGSEIAGFNPSQPLSGRTNSVEFFTEALVPLLGNLPFVERLDLTLGYRIADYYNTSGITHSYRADLDWEMVPGLRLRGGYQQAVRAPNIGELFAAPGTNFPNIGNPLNASGAPVFGGDPCDSRGLYRNGPNAAQVEALCLAQGFSPAALANYTFTNNQVPGTVGGNPDLSEETAETYTIGLVWQSPFQSPWTSGLSASIDYYNIEIENVIGSVGASDQLQGCFNAQGQNPTYDPNNAFCVLFGRDPLSGNINSSTSNQQNLGELLTSGVDAQIDWRWNMGDVGLPDWGSIDINTVVGWLENRESSVVAGGPLTDRTGTIASTFGNTFPEWKSLVSARWSLGPASLGVRWRRVGELTIFASEDVIEPTHYFDLFGSFDINDAVTLRAGVNNVEDQQPRLFAPGVQANTDPSTYDVLGRRYFVGLTARF